jgi:signal transduction histidine kinase
MSFSDDEAQGRYAATVLEGTGPFDRSTRRLPEQTTVTATAATRTFHRSAGAAATGLVPTQTIPGSDAVEAQQRFLAYAAHELRGSITLQRTLAEVAIADPDAGTIALRAMAARVVVACERQERLLEALLTLARSKCGHLRREPVDLSATVAEVLRSSGPHAIRSTTALEFAPTTGDAQLVERLVANLLVNAVLHNVPGGRLHTATYVSAGRAVFAIANTGPVVPAAELARLFQPFQRLRSHSGHAGDGVGLGLALVQAIADAHDATITAAPRAGGGLRIDVAFPALD